MRFLRYLITATLSISSIRAGPVKSRSPYAVKDSHHVPTRWCRIDRAPAEHLINLQIGLKQGQFAELERNLYEVSDPSHARYGKHLSAEEVDELVKPSDEALELVHDWLMSNGIEASQLSYSPAKDWIKIDLPVSAIESLLDTEYSIFEDGEGLKVVRTPQWSLPIHLHEHIATIQPTNSFFRPEKRSKIAKRDTLVKIHHPWGQPSLPSQPSAATIAAACNETLVTPLCLRTLYGTVNYTVQSDKNVMALNDFLGEVNNRSDTEIYLEMFRPEAVAGAYQFEQISIAGGTVQQTPDNTTQFENEVGVEGDLDVETMLGIAWPTPLIAYSTGGSPPFMPDAYTPTDTNEPYLVWLEYILSQPDPLPSVVSSSYDDDEQTVPYSYAVQVCNMFAQLGARGVTVFFGSGDEGVGTDGFCYSNDGTNRSTFLPEFPSACPYVTSVGATYQFEPEVAAYDGRFSPAFTSGGGFSNYFPRPAYQDAAVSNYLSKYIGSEYAGLYNPSGRGIPDIAAQGVNFSTVWNGTVVPVDGTSAATPTAAAVIALVNDALIAAGKSPLGFMNPWLYSGGYKAFNDIVSGSSAGCNTSGFPAAIGWDAVTGLGTPYFPDILALLGIEDGLKW